MRRLYSIATYLLLPLVLLHLAWRGLRNRAYWQRWSERFGIAPKGVQPRGIWVHAVSVGEINAASPLIHALLDRYPKWPITVTTFTPTGSDWARRLFGSRVGHCYVPLDTPRAVGRFVKFLQPRLLVVMETEIWPNLYAAAERAGTPILMANARISENSLRGYQRWDKLTRLALGHISRIAAQSGTDADRLRQLGAPGGQIEVTGNMKFDLPAPDSLHDEGRELRRRWGPERPVWIAASTHEDEERQILKVHHRLRDRHPDLVLIIAPRHPERFDQIAHLIDQQGLEWTRRSEQANPTPDTQIYLLDTLGELMRFYAASDLAFLGGSLVPVGGHNVLEPAALGIPVLVGPHTENCAELVEKMLENGSALQLQDRRELKQAIFSLLEDQAQRDAMGRAGRALVHEGQGAVARTFAIANDLLAGQKHG